MMETFKLPLGVRVIYCSSEAECRAACGYITRDSVWGMDIEWKVNYIKGATRNPAALIQFSNHQLIIIIHIYNFGMISELAQILQDVTIRKVGVNISGDRTILQTDFGDHLTEVRGCYEIIKLFRATGWCKKDRSLRSLVQSELGLDLPKTVDLRCGDWEVCPLSKDQINYAALDAYASYCLFELFALKYDDLISSIPKVGRSNADEDLLKSMLRNSCPRTLAELWYPYRHLEVRNRSESPSPTAVANLEKAAKPSVVPAPTLASGSATAVVPPSQQQQQQQQQQQFDWPAITKSGMQCKLCLKKSRGVFCHVHAISFSSPTNAAPAPPPAPPPASNSIQTNSSGDRVDANLISKTFVSPSEARHACNRTWPAITKSGMQCKLCLKKSRGVFCHLHSIH